MRLVAMVMRDIATAKLTTEPFNLVNLVWNEHLSESNDFQIHPLKFDALQAGTSDVIMELSLRNTLGLTEILALPLPKSRLP